jgi:hypothetical protein
MNKQIKKSLMAVAVGAALASAGITAANAASLLFPYWSTQNGTTSILSLSTGTVVAPAAGTLGNIHYVWNYGKDCTHFDNYGTMTSNDLLQQFVSQPAGTPALFGDKSKPNYFPQLQGGSYGFLVVADDAGSPASPTGAAGTLRGQMIVASAAAGIVTAYNGIESASTSTIEGDFSNLNATAYRLSWYPQSVAGTSWYAVATGNMNAAIVAGANWNGAATYTNNGQVYGRDEDAYSGSMTGKFTCSASMTPESFMNSAQIASATNGGLVNVNFTPATGTTGVLMTKLETTTALGGANTFVTGEKATSGQGW